MTSKKRVFSDLTPETPFPYTVKAKLTKKTGTLIGASQDRYQHLVFEDEQGHAMRATLFNQDIETYESTIEEGHDYDISNPKIRKVKETYKSKYRDVDNEHELSFTKRTIIKRLANTDESSVPMYLSLLDIPRVANPGERFDLLAVVIYAEDRRKITGFDGTNRDVRELVTIDDSTNQLITISAWHELAKEKTETLQELSSFFPIVGFRRLKISNYKGFSLSTTPSTCLIGEPKGERVETLKKWRDSNLDLLIHRQMQVINARKPPEETENISIKEIQQQQVDETIQEEQHWLRIFIPDFRSNQINMYLGCSHCNLNFRYEGMTIHKCPECNEHDSISARRLILNFKATDKTGTLLLIAHALAAEKILQRTVVELYEMNKEDRESYYESLSETLRTTPTYILLTPSVILSTNRVLQWVVKSAKSI